MPGISLEPPKQPKQCTHMPSFVHVKSSDLKRVPYEEHNYPYADRSVVCEDCIKEPNPLWVHLRQCLVCGHVGCCNSSPKKHATLHFVETGHMLSKSIEPGENWGWCYIDELMLILPASLIEDLPQSRAATGYGEEV